MSTLASAARSAPAKVNLLLRVLGARSDGFHDIETLFQAVSLHDDVTVELTDGHGVEIEVSGADVGPPESNLALRAARAVLDATGSRGEPGEEPRGMRVVLEKRIPAGAGLGGGSSDAAAALLCANAVLGGVVDGPALRRMAAALGSDVPFFLGESTLALGAGRGQLLEALPPLPVAHVVLVLPPVHVPTGWAYGALDAWRRGGGEAPCLGLQADAPAEWAEVAALARNDFETVVAGTHPEVAESLRALGEAGGTPVLLSGSGAACFGVFNDAAAADRAAASLSEGLAWPAVVVNTLRTWPEVRLR